MITKQHKAALLAMALAFIPGRTGLAAQTPPGEIKDRRIYAQILVDETVAKNPDLILIGIHAVAPREKESKLVASNIGPGGKKDGDQEISVATARKVMLGPRPGRPGEFEVLLPLTAAPGTIIGALQLVFKYRAGDDESAYFARALAIRDILASKIPSRPSLFRIPAPWMARS